jgi:hypothetical protein
MVDSRDKGARAELKVRDELRKLTLHKWERTPSSGALSAVHMMKGDLYIPGVANIYCVEVKHYAEDQLTSKILTTTVKSTFDLWWEQTIRESHETNRKPLLIFKHDRGKLMCAVDDIITPPNKLPVRYFLIGHLNVWVLKLEDFINYCKPNFVL